MKSFAISILFLLSLFLNILFADTAVLLINVSLPYNTPENADIFIVGNLPEFGSWQHTSKLDRISAKTAQKKITNIPKNPLSKLRKDIEKYKILYIHTSLIFLFINICLIISILVISNHIPPQVPLYYGLPRGESQLGSSLSLILPISLSSIFVAINSIISYFTVSSFLKKVLIIGSYFTVILSIITVIQIISLLIFF